MSEFASNDAYLSPSILYASWIRSTDYILNFSAGNFTCAEPLIYS